MRSNSIVPALLGVLVVVFAAAVCSPSAALGAALWEGLASNDFNSSANWVEDDAQTTHVSPSGKNCYLYLNTPNYLDLNVTDNVDISSLCMNWPGSTNPVTIGSTADKVLRLTSTGTGLETLSGMGTLTVNSKLAVYTTADQTWNIKSNVVLNGVVSSVMNGSRLRDVMKTGTGALTLNGANTFGDTSNWFDLLQGTLNLGNASALGGYTLHLGGASAGMANFDNTSGGSMVITANNPQVWGHSSTGLNATFVGTDDLNIGTGQVTLYPGFTLDINAGTLTVDGVVQSWSGLNGTLTKTGDGALLLNGDNLYGTTTVNDGTFGGTGSLTGKLTIASGATVSPGESVGVFTCKDGLKLNDGALLAFELAGVGASDMLEQFQNSTLELSGQEFADFTFTPLAGFGPGTYTLIHDAGSVVGSLGSNLSGTVGGLSCTLGIADPDANGFSDVVLTVVPEPSVIVLLATGLVGLLAYAWRRRK